MKLNTNFYYKIEYVEIKFEVVLKKIFNTQNLAKTKTAVCSYDKN